MQAAYLTSGLGRSQQAADSLVETLDWLVPTRLPRCGKNPGDPVPGHGCTPVGRVLGVI